MIVIGICDGEQAVRSLLASFVERYRNETDSQIQLLSYSTGEKLIKNYILDLDLIFLEIPLHKANGLRIAEFLRQEDPQVRIVFLTTVLSYVLEAYEVGANNYLLKPLSYTKFCQEISRICAQKEGKESLSFLEQNRTGLYKIYHHQIRFIETYEKNTLIHTEKDSIQSFRQMKQFEQILAGSTFIRCHAGYIVNLRYFKKMENSMIILTDGTSIPVSRSRKGQVLEQIKKIYGE